MIRKFGGTMWETLDGLLIPQGLHDKEVDRDHVSLDKVARCLGANRKVEPVLELIQRIEWHDWPIVWTYLETSFHARRGYAEMMMADEWWPYWNSLCVRYIRPDK